MKKIVTFILQEGEQDPVPFKLAISKSQSPLIVIKQLLRLRNLSLLPGEKEISLVRIREKVGVSYEHDWKKSGDHYVCVDCRVPGQRINILGQIRTTFKQDKYKNCKWKIK
jgi:hypothetical protein